jgi:hypothetical protein
MRAVVIALCSLILFQVANADDLAKEETFNMWARAFAQKLQGKVSAGWIVLYEEKEHSIKIMRDRAVVSRRALSNSSDSAPEELAWPDLNLKVMLFVSHEEYQRQKAGNLQVPDGYDQNLSFTWLTPQPLWSSGMVPRDEYVRQEAETVFKQGGAAFSKY